MPICIPIFASSDTTLDHLFLRMPLDISSSSGTISKNGSNLLKFLIFLAWAYGTT